MTITLTREEAQQVLDAMEYHVAQTRPITRTQETIETLRARLAQPEPEPVACPKEPANVEELYTAPPQRKEWQGLTDEDRWELVQKTPSFNETVAAVEAKLKEKNG
jgi:hypothetical protein